MATPTKELIVIEDMNKPEIMESFTKMLGRDAEPFVQSVLILVASDDKLRQCTPQSIYKSALRAASLGLSCDPAVKQGWIIPRNKKIKEKTIVVDDKKTTIPEHWEKEAQFQPHYLGLYNLAMRTGKYWNINVSAVYEGQRVLENPLTGLHVVVESNGFVGEPKAYNPAFIDVTTRRKKDMKVIGWIGYFKAKKGNEKSIWMSIAEIEDHAIKYVPDYDRNPSWNDPDKRPTMEMKTVLKKLLAWADLSGTENAKLAEALKADNETIDAAAEDIPTPTSPDWTGTPEEWIEESETTETKSTQPPAPPPPPVETCDPSSDQAVGYAAQIWDAPPAKVRKDIKKALELGKIKNPMPKEDFKKWVANPQGEPEPA